MAVPTPAALLDRLRRDAERNVARARNGLKHLAGVDHVAVGCSPKELVWRRGKVQLFRYHSEQRRLGPPILLVMSLVTKPYVLDLRPGNSFVEALLARGFDVYLLDWGTPDAAEADNGFETYCDEYLPYASAFAMRTSGASELHLFGYCFGGVLSLLFAAAHPEIPLRTLSLMATPVDFAAIGGITGVLRDERVELDGFLDETGNVPATTVLRGIAAARVTGDASTLAALLENLDSAEYLAAHQAMNGWATDHIPFPGACFRQTAQWIIRENRLATNQIVTERGPVDLSAITCPVMNVVGTGDHLIPLVSNAPIAELLPHAEQFAFDAGHVGLIIGGKAHRVSIPAMADWIERHSDER
jgi:polyhydroxyalkanoate synthase